jgi:hypothetical protein
VFVADFVVVPHRSQELTITCWLVVLATNSERPLERLSMRLSVEGTRLSVEGIGTFRQS